MRLALFRALSPADQKKEVAKAKIKIQKSYEELCRLGVWHSPPKGFPKEINEYTLWERKT